MQIEEAIHVLHPDSAESAKEEIFFYGGFKAEEAYRKIYESAARLACDIMWEHLKSTDEIDPASLADFAGGPVWMTLPKRIGAFATGWYLVESRGFDHDIYLKNLTGVLFCKNALVRGARFYRSPQMEDVQ